jgi:hypothetical protein
MHFTPSKPLFNITVPQPKAPVFRATPQSILTRPKVTTEQALKGYDYLKSHSSRNNTAIHRGQPPAGGCRLP